MTRVLIAGGICLLGTLTGWSQYKEEYVQKFRDIAVSEMYRTGIPASIKLSQAILESNYGRSELAREAHNHFGIKCGRDWSGKGYSLKDDDYDSRGELVHSCFRVFRSDDESFIAHSDFLSDPNKAQRYGALFSLAPDDYKGWAEGLKRSGYATNPDYARRLIQIIEEQQLFRYDVREIDDPVVESRHRRDRDDDHAPNINQAIYGRDAYTIGYQNDIPYVVARPGDDLKAISKRTDVSIHQIIKYNEIVENRKADLNAGDRIYLQPMKRKYHGRESSHVVEPGESVAQIAHDYGIKADVLRKRNNMAEDCEPATGSRLVLRGKQKHTIRCASDEPTIIARVQKPVSPPPPVSPAVPPAEPSVAEPTITREVKEAKPQQVLQASAPDLSDMFVKDILSYTVQPKDTLYQIASSHGLSVAELKKINNLTDDVIHPGQSLKVQR